MLKLINRGMEYILEVDHGNAKAGTVLVRGLHEVPTYYEGKETLTSSDFFWHKGSKKEDDAFLMASWIVDKNGMQVFPNQ